MNVHQLNETVAPALASAAAGLKQIQITANATRADTQIVRRVVVDHFPSNLESDIQKLSLTTNDVRDITARVEQGLSLMIPELHSISHGVISTKSVAGMAQSAALKAQVAVEQVPIELQELCSRFDFSTTPRFQADNACRTNTQLCVRLMQKPSHLCEQFDGVRWASASSLLLCPTRPRKGSRPCGCAMEAKRRRNVTKRLLWILNETKQTHLPSCKHFSRQDWTVKAGVTLVSWTLLMVLQLSFRATKGAGAFPLSPNIAVTRLVDRQVSPAFNIFDKIIRAFSRRQLTSGFWEGPWAILPGYLQYVEPSNLYTPLFLRWDMTGLERHLEHALVELQSLFESGAASPLDTDVEGRTLLHVRSLFTLILGTNLNDTDAVFKGGCHTC